MLIVHIARKEDWVAAQEGDEYLPPEFADDGFIHASTPEQVAVPANEKYSGQDDLVLLWIDVVKMTTAVVYERNEEGGDLYPHIRGPVNLDAVVSVNELKPWQPGGFVLPRAPAR